MAKGRVIRLSGRPQKSREWRDVMDDCHSRSKCSWTRTSLQNTTYATPVYEHCTPYRCVETFLVTSWVFRTLLNPNLRMCDDVVTVTAAAVTTVGTMPPWSWSTRQKSVRFICRLRSPQVTNFFHNNAATTLIRLPLRAVNLFEKHVITITVNTTPRATWSHSAACWHNVFTCFVHFSQ
jgi:hypothetical protein